ncbi:WD40/YVTN/BNR-like repeat-containing protein [Cupriavidus necator]|nr:YCF48-related protein [Cupriavidus necator]
MLNFKLRSLAIAAFAAGQLNAGFALAAAATPIINPAAPAERIASALTSGMLAAQKAGNRVVAVGNHGVILLSDDDGKTFRQAASVPTRATLTAVAFADARNGWAVGHWGVVLHTGDGGENWTLQRSDIATDRPLFSVYFKDAAEGWAAGLWSLMLHTADGGKTWAEVKLPAPAGATKADANLYAIAGAKHGAIYVAAERGLLLKSTDGGQNWTYCQTGEKGSLWSALVLQDGSVLAGGLRGALTRSTDGGQTWTSVRPDGYQNSITALAQGADGHVTAVGLDGLVLSSENGGATFKGAQRPDRLPLNAVVARGAKPLLFSQGGPVSDE